MVNSRFSVLCLLHTDTNLPAGLPTFSPSSLQPMGPMTKDSTSLKHCSGGVAPCSQPLPREERLHFCTCYPRLLCKSPSHCLTHFLSSLEQTVVDSGCLASFLFFFLLHLDLLWGTTPQPLWQEVESHCPYRSQREFIVPLPAPVQLGG